MASEGTERHFSTTDDAAQRWTQRITLRTTFGQDPPVLVVFLVLALIWSAASQVCPLLCARSYLECCFAVSCLVLDRQLLPQPPDHYGQMSLHSLPKPEDNKSRQAATSMTDPKADSKDVVAKQPPSTSLSIDSDMRSIIMSIPAQIAALEARVQKSENLGLLVASPAMAQPLPPAAPRRGETKSALFAQLREAIAENGDVLVAGAGASSRQGVSRVAAAGPQARPSPAPPGPAAAAAAQEAVSQESVPHPVDFGPSRGPADAPEAPSLLSDLAIAYSCSQAEAAGGFHHFYMLKLSREMKDVGLKGEVEFLSRVLDDLLSEFQCPPTHALFRKVLARIKALHGFDKTRNPAYLKIMAPAEDRLFDPATEHAIDKAVVEQTRPSRQLLESATGGQARARGGGRRGGGWVQQRGGRGGANQQQQHAGGGGGGGGRGGGRGGRGGGNPRQAPAAGGGGGGPSGSGNARGPADE